MGSCGEGKGEGKGRGRGGMKGVAGWLEKKVVVFGWMGLSIESLGAWRLELIRGIGEIKREDGGIDLKRWVDRG